MNDAAFCGKAYKWPLNAEEIWVCLDCHLKGTLKEIREDHLGEDNWFPKTKPPDYQKAPYDTGKYECPSCRLKGPLWEVKAHRYPDNECPDLKAMKVKGVEDSELTKKVNKRVAKYMEKFSYHKRAGPD